MKLSPQKIRKLVIVFGIAFLFWASGFIHARSQAAFLKTGVGAKARGVGNIYEASVDNPTAIYWNPAGLGHIYGREEIVKKKRRKKKKKKNKKEEKTGDDDAKALLDQLSKGLDAGSLDASVPPLDDGGIEPEVEKTFGVQFTGSYTNLLQDRNVVFAGTGIYLPGAGTLGVGWLHTREDGIRGANTAGSFTSDFDYSANAFFLSYGQEVGNLRAGASLKGIQEKISSTSYTGGGFDVGVQMDLLSSFIQLGAVVQDLVSIVPEGDDLEEVDRTLGFAVTINPPTASNVYFMIGTRINLSADETSDFGIGLKYEFSRGSISLGYTGRGPSLGGGLEFKYFDFDLAVSNDNLDSDNGDLTLDSGLLTTIELTAKFE